MIIEQAINNRLLTSYHAVETELELDKSKNYLFDLSYLAVLNASGDKTLEFLQGQLSCDLRKLSDIQIMRGVQCNLKGRILSLLDIISWKGTQLVLPQDLLVATQNSLSKTALLSKVSLTKNSELKIFGFLLQNPNDLLPGIDYFPTALHAKAETAHCCYYHLGFGFYVILIDKQLGNEISDPFRDKNQLLGSLTWHTLRLKHQQFEIYPESRGLFLPLRLSLQKTSLISFDKGCYKGQEIIARTYYKSTIKHELKTFTVTLNTSPYSGQKLFKPGTKIECGELIDYSYLGATNYLIALSLHNEANTAITLERSEETVSLL